MIGQGACAWWEPVEEAMIRPPRAALQTYIQDVRNCTTKEQEKERVDKELGKIRKKYTSDKALTGAGRPRPRRRCWRARRALDVQLAGLAAVQQQRTGGLCARPQCPAGPPRPEGWSTQHKATPPPGRMGPK